MPTLMPTLSIGRKRPAAVCFTVTSPAGEKRYLVETPATNGAFHLTTTSTPDGVEAALTEEATVIFVERFH